MSIELTLPIGKKTTVKNMIFSILRKEYPLKLIEITNYIKKRYGVSVTFQAVRKAVLQLIDEEVLLQQEKEFMINKNWVKQSKNVIDELYLELNQKKGKSNSLDSIQGEVSVFTFNSINEMMKFWQDIIDHWYENFQKGDLAINCYQGAHVWEGLLHLNREHILMERLKKKGIKSYLLTTGNSELDKNLIKFYEKIADLKTQLVASTSNFDKSFYIGTYGHTIVQCQYPEKIVKELNTFFKTNKSFDHLELSKLSDIINQEIEVKLTVIKNEAMAKQINLGIMSQF
jgi:hypothetical protein